MIRLVRLQNQLRKLNDIHKLSNQIRCCSATAPLPSTDDGIKEYSPKIQNLVDEISKLTILEVSDLNQLLKKTLNISDAPVMMAGAVAGVAAPKEEEEEEEATQAVQTSFTVRLTKFDETKKVPLIKYMKSVMEGMNLVQAKKFVESLPAVVRSDVSKEEAEELKEGLIAAGGECTVE